MVEAAPTTTRSVKLIIGDSQSDGMTLNTMPDQVELLLGLMQQKTLSAIETAEGITLSADCAKSAQFWQHAFAALSEQGTIQAWFSDSGDTQAAITNMTKLYGFVDVQCSNPNFQQGKVAIIARRPVFKVGGTSLKRKKKPAAEPAASENPWANLATTETGQINEDSLMVDEA